MATKNLRWVMVITLLFTCTIAFMDRVNFGISVPLIMKEFSLNATMIGIIMSGFNIGYTLAVFPGGFLPKWFSSRAILAIAFAGWSISTLFVGWANGFLALLIARVVFGIFEAPFFPNAYKVSGTWSLPKDIGLTTSLTVLGTPIGILLGNLIAAPIVATWGWRSVFFIFGGVGLVVALILWVVLRDAPHEHPWISPEELDLIQSSKVQAGMQETTADIHHMSLGEIFKSPAVWGLFLSFFAVNLAFWANVNWLPTYFVQARGSNIMAAGINASIPWLAMAIGVVLWGKIGDLGKAYKGKVLAFCTLVMAPFIVMAILSPSLNMCLLFFSIANFLYGGALVMTPAYELAIWHTHDVPKIHGLVMVGMSVAGIIAPTLVGYILDVTGSFNMAYFIFAIGVFIAGFAGLYLYKLEKDHRSLTPVAN